MKEQIDDFKKFINEEFNKSGEQIEKAIESHPEISKIRASEEQREKVYQRIEEYERDKEENLLDYLSDEDREALRIGREALAQKEKEKSDKKTRKKKMLWKRVAAAAAIVVMVSAVGITSVGGPKKLVEVVERLIEGRDVTQTQTNSEGEETKISEDGKAEKAYQKVKNELGIYVVQLVVVDSNIKFQSLEIDKDLRMAQFFYSDTTNDKIITYIVSCSYSDDALGITSGDVISADYEYQLAKTSASIKEYELKGERDKKYSAEFEYKEVYYKLTSVMEKDRFDEILENLHF